MLPAGVFAHSGSFGYRERAVSPLSDPSMPQKHNDPRRHHIPRARHKVKNWPEYDRELVERGDIRFWISEDALTG